MHSIKLTHDRTLDITEFKSLTDTKSYNISLTFSQFIGKLQEPKISKEKGSAGGFVAGFVKEKRNNANVKTRSMLTIDIDDTKDIDVWAHVEESNISAAMYSTHRSTLDAPRYRLVIPLATDIEVNEYEAVMRFILNMLQIPFDKTTTEHARLMYYPTCELLENYEFYYQDKGLFNPDNIPEGELKQFKDIAKFTKSDFKKRDPREKKNWIGAWCSVYTITDAIEKYLSDVYEPYHSNRYTYIAGTTPGGLVIYDDDQHAHSNHESDPISGMNVNSFDLVRLHLYGRLDKGSRPDASVNSLPSYKEMIKLCRNDEVVQGYFKKNIKQDPAEVFNKQPTEFNLKKALEDRRFEELEKMLFEWESNGAKGRKPSTINALRCSKILPEYVDFILFDLEENTRVAMYQPDKGIYTRNTTLIKRVISWLEPTLNSNRADEVIYHLTNSAQVKEPTNSRYLIPVKNGVFNLKTKELEPFTPEYVFTSKIETPYMESPFYPIIDGWDIESWLESIACKDKELVNLLWQVINDSLNGNYSRKKAIFLVGGGNNGKGTFQELITNLIGIQNVARLKVNEFEERFKLGVLEGKSVVIGDDVPANVYIDDSSNFNSVVTGDGVLVEIKNKQPYNAAFNCGVIQSTNGMPKFRNKTEGTTRRVLIVPFNADFNGTKENFKIKDEYIKQDKVLEYVLYKAINMDFEKFDIPKASEQELESFKQDNDPVLDFKYSIFDEWEIPEVPKVLVYESYKNFCQDNNFKPLSNRQFHHQFKKYLNDSWKDGKKRFKEEDLDPYIANYGFMPFGFPDPEIPQRSYRRD